MPVIEITMGKVNRDVKKSLIEKITAEAIAITKLPATEFTVFIHELEYDNIGRSGQTLTDLFAARAKE